MKITNLKSISLAVMLAMSPLAAESGWHKHGRNHHNKEQMFKRIATFPVYLNTDINNETVAEIVASSRDGNTLVYTDGKMNSVGFVNIKNPANPLAAGLLNVGGEPTSVAVSGNYALVGVNTSPNYVAPNGQLQVIDLETQSTVATLELAGQPDSVATSPDGRYAAVVIENERDEDYANGEPPQSPAGFMVIVDMIGAPGDWTTRTINLTGMAEVFPEDPEPEYVDINDENIAVITLQENNHIALIDLASGAILNHFTAGTVDLEHIDIKKDKMINLNGSLQNIPREPDGVNWLSNTQFATADEGDLFGGSRGFTIFNIDGSIAYNPGNSVEHIIAQYGHYPEKRAGKKGNEPENVEYGKFENKDLLFVGSERASVVLVYETRGKSRLKLKQVLPTPVKPEGLLAIPQRNLFISAGEEDSRDDKIRSALSIYQLSNKANYPSIISKSNHKTGPVTWGALSGLAFNQRNKNIAYAVQDSFYQKSAILKMNISRVPAVINHSIPIKDSLSVLAQIAPSLINSDMSVNLDPEGIATRKQGGFWIVSEGTGTIGDEDKPVESLNLLLKVKRNGVIEEAITLPDQVNAKQQRFGFEGVTSTNKSHHEKVYIAFQREWQGDPDHHVRIGQYDTVSGEWNFFYYPVETAASENGGWVGLSDISYLGNDEFAVIERDNQAGPDAVIKRIYKFSIAGLKPLSDNSSANFPVVQKTQVRDLMNDLKATGGLVLEKIEGLAINHRGDAFVVNDNDGVDDSNGETQLLRFNSLFKK